MGNLKCRRCGCRDSNVLPRDYYNVLVKAPRHGTEIACLSALKKRVRKLKRERDEAQALVREYASEPSAAELAEMIDLNDMAARVVAMCAQRLWSMHWTHRGAYLHLESSELIEAVRGKRSSSELERIRAVTEEAGDVLLVLMSITEYAGVPFESVVREARQKLAGLETRPPYPGEEREPES